MRFKKLLQLDQRLCPLPNPGGQHGDLELRLVYRQEGAGHRHHLLRHVARWDFCSSICISAAPKKRIIKKFPTGNFFIIYVYSTVTDFARLRGLSTSHPLQTAV